MQFQTEYQLLRSWEKLMKLNEIMHRKSFEYYRFLNISLMIPITIFSGLSGVVGIATIKDNNDNDSIKFNIIALINGVLGISAAILTTIYNFLGVPESQQIHRLHCSEYNKIAREISTELILIKANDNIYANLGEFIKICRYRIDRLIDNSPPIPSYIFKQYQQEFIEINNPIIEDLDKEYEGHNNTNNRTSIIVHSNPNVDLNHFTSITNSEYFDSSEYEITVH